MLGYGYGSLVAHRPFSGLLTPLLAVLFGSLLGLAVSRALSYAKVRSDWAARGVALFAGGIALYAAWAAWITAIVHGLGVTSEFHEFLLHPARLGDAALAVNRTGHWTLFALRPVGAGLAALWIAEAAIVWGAALVMTESQLNERGFCEGCGTWTVRHEGVARLPGDEFLDFRRHLEEHDLAYLASLGEAAPDASSWTALDLLCCPRCGALNLLDAWRVTLRGKPGEQREARRLVSAKLILRSEEARAIRALAARQQKAEVRARAAAAGVAAK